MDAYTSIALFNYFCIIMSVIIVLAVAGYLYYRFHKPLPKDDVFKLIKEHR